MAEFGENVRMLRQAKGLTQQSLADQLYVTRQAASVKSAGEGLFFRKLPLRPVRIFQVVFRGFRLVLRLELATAYEATGNLFQFRFHEFLLFSFVMVKTSLI